MTTTHGGWLSLWSNNICLLLSRSCWLSTSTMTSRPNWHNVQDLGQDGWISSMHWPRPRRFSCMNRWSDRSMNSEMQFRRSGPTRTRSMHQDYIEDTLYSNSPIAYMNLDHETASSFDYIQTSHDHHTAPLPRSPYHYESASLPCISIKRTCIKNTTTIAITNSIRKAMIIRSCLESGTVRECTIALS